MRRIKKLTREQKRLVWAPPTSNAGVGWGNDYYRDRTYPDEERGTITPTIPLDNIEKVCL